jgi:mRNA interferase RelE/StbE
MFSIEFSQTAGKQLLKLDKNIQERIVMVLERIRERPFHFIKRKEGTPNFIVRSGDYRAVLDVDLQKSIIFILEVEHRKNIYK